MAASRFTVRKQEEGIRLDLLLTRRIEGLGRAGARRLLDAGAVRVNGRPRTKGSPVKPGERVTVANRPPTKSFAPLPHPDLGLRIRYQDRHLIVIDKAAGVPIHPLRPDDRGTLANAVAARFPETIRASDHPREAGLVHRLDTGTSGLVMAARSSRVYRALRAAITAGEVEKRYRALCAGRVSAPRIIEAFLVADRKNRKRVRVSATARKRSRPAATEIIRARRHADYSLVEVRVFTAGRHQIRAHLAHLGHPLVGDTLYGGPDAAALGRHFLHASSIRMRHPVTAIPLRISSPLPSGLRRFLKEL